MRGFFRVLLGFFFIIIASLLVTVFSLKSTLLSHDYVTSKLAKYDIYTKIYTVIPEITETLVSEAEKNDPPGEGDNPLSGKQLGDIITNSVTPGIIKEKTEGFLTGFYSWLYGEGPDIPEISFLDIKPKLENYAASEMGVSKEAIAAGQTGFNIPDKIQIKPSPPFSLARSICADYPKALAILIVLSIVLMAGVIALSGPGLPNYLKRPGSPMIILSVWLFLNAGFVWLFLNAGNMLYRRIAEALKGASKSTSVIFGLANEIVFDVLGTVLLFAGLFLFLGVALKIAGSILKKMQIKKETPTKNDKKETE